MIKIAVNGVCGRMGRLVLSLAADDPEMEVVAGLEHKGHVDIGQDLGSLIGRKDWGIPVSTAASEAADVLIDFSLPPGTIAQTERCLEHETAMVIGTTGFSPEQVETIKAAAKDIAIVFSPNMSIGVNVLFALVRKAASLLDAGYDAEIVELHHRFKADSPSGTAKKLVDMILEGRQTKSPQIVFGRHGRTGERKSGEIGVHAVRAGDIVGEHRTIFSTIGETIEISHRAHSREGFALGAIEAARFAAGGKPGLYSMADVLGIS